MSTDSWIAQLREQHCKRDDAGAWLCQSCDAALTETDAVQCPSCVTAGREQAEEEARQRRRLQWQEEQRKRHAKVIEQLPAGDHIKDLAAVGGLVERRFLAVAHRLELKGSVLLLGQSGAGKTTVMAAGLYRLGAERLQAVLANPRDPDARKAFEEFARVRWVTAWDIGRALSAHRLGTGGEPELVAQAVESSFLVIDELGPEPAHLAGVLFDIIDRRSKRGAHTAATSGLSAEAFQGRYGSGMWRRLTERGLGDLVDVHPRGARGG